MLECKPYRDCSGSPESPPGPYCWPDSSSKPPAVRLIQTLRSQEGLHLVEHACIQPMTMRVVLHTLVHRKSPYGRIRQGSRLERGSTRQELGPLHAAGRRRLAVQRTQENGVAAPTSRARARVNNKTSIFIVDAAPTACSAHVTRGNVVHEVSG